MSYSWPVGARHVAIPSLLSKAAEWLQGLRASLRTGPTVLFAEAHNARSHWTWLQDGRIERDRLQDGLAPARRLDPDLRMVRVRAGARNETPQWWGKAPEGTANGIQQGLWVPEDAAEDARVFFSTTAKPVQFKHAAVAADKLSPRPIAQGKRKGEPTIDTGQAAWMPGLLEIAVVGCHQDDGDDPKSLALLRPSPAPAVRGM
ncbi:RNAseH domain-containing protein [Streptomyces sp. NPDC056921]|uniref:RNAseH domain-containing protein n=1 Tax=Streptomyces sp. NPDC056921 TaxID=3345966 RepID=UPI00363A4137